MSRSSGPTCRALSKAGTLSLQNSKCLADQVKAAVEFSCLFLDNFRVNDFITLFAITMKLLGRILLASSAIVLAIGAWIPTAGFDGMSARVAKSDLNPFLGRGLKVFFLQASTTASVLLSVLPLLAIHPAA